MSAAELPKGMCFVGLWGGVQGVKRRDGELVENMRRVTVVVPGVGEDGEDEHLTAMFFVESFGVATKIAAQIADLALLQGEPVCLKVDLAKVESKYLNFTARRVVRLSALAGPPPLPAAEPGNGRKLTAV